MNTAMILAYANSADRSTRFAANEILRSQVTGESALTEPVSVLVEISR